MKKLLFLIVAVSSFVLSSCQTDDGKKYQLTDTERNALMGRMQNAVAEQSQWTKVHAAEYLIDLGYHDGLYQIFEREDELYSQLPEYRIGIWRMLARLCPEEERKDWIDKIIGVFEDPTADDREHAAEALAKLGVSVAQLDIAEQTINDILNGEKDGLAVFTLWSLATADSRYNEELLDAAISNDLQTRSSKLAAYALRYLGNLKPQQWSTLSNQVFEKSSDNGVLLYRLSAAYVNAPADSLDTETYRKLEEQLSVKTSDGPLSKELILAMSYSQNPEHYRKLRQMQNQFTELGVSDKDLGLEMAVDYALLKIEKAQERSLSLLDWLVIFLYLGGMLWIGWYYSNKNKTAEDYLLGGRKMNPVAVGISLFATLLSTLSYLSYPGEMINYGPVIFTGMLAFPLVYYAVGWWIIPKIMNVNVTSAYEILERRFGLKVRMLAVAFFLCLRLLWMASIMYVTIDVALLSVVPIDKSFAPFIGIFLILVAIIYTSMGGMKAVVVTDVIQSLIFLSGAFLCIIVAAIEYESLFGWLPDHWLTLWSAPEIRFDLTERLTVGNAVLTLFLWYICTAGGDQTAIQRYLSTRDVQAARKTLRVSLYTNLLAKILLALVGLAVLAFFMKNVHLQEYGKTIEEQADLLFPRFILVGLPKGLSGLMIAALFAAAMSSLSSGLNSVSTVVSEDIIKRFNFNFLGQLNELQKIKVLSYVIGVIVMLLSLFVGNVEGNLIDVINKVVNLFVAPLFVLFFMAFFVKRANSNSTFIAGLVSISTGIAIAFFGLFGITVLWILPMSMIVGIVVGLTLSAFNSPSKIS